MFDSVTKALQGVPIVGSFFGGDKLSMPDRPDLIAARQRQAQEALLRQQYAMANAATGGPLGGVGARRTAQMNALQGQQNLANSAMQAQAQEDAEWARMQLALQQYNQQRADQMRRYLLMAGGMGLGAAMLPGAQFGQALMGASANGMMR